MADAPQPWVQFTGGCPDPGRRVVDLPRPLPEVGDDFDWRVRDFDGFRRLMLEELAARHPERRRWTEADFEVVIVEALAAVLDQLSDMADRVAAESFLQTARRPASVRALLRLIGYEPEESTDADWYNEPWRMEAARRAGPRSVQRLERMVTVDDHRTILERHPLVLRASAWSEWNGAWEEVKVAVILPGGPLDTRLAGEGSSDVPGQPLRDWVERHHGQDRAQALDGLTSRAVLRWWVDAHRMVGRQVTLVDARPVGIVIGLRVHLLQSYFRSEVRQAIEMALGADGFFRQGRLDFGEDVHVSQLTSLIQGLPGVMRADITALHRVGQAPEPGRVPGDLHLHGLELAVCDNDPDEPARGWWQVEMCGGQPG